MIESFFREMRYGVRALLRDKGFAATVILTLAFCLAANTATFAIVNSVLLRPLSMPKADQIVVMANRYPNAGVPDSNQSSSGDYFDRLRAVTALQEQAMFRIVDETLYHDRTAEQVTGLSVTPSFFPLVHVAPALGRAFTATEAEPGKDQEIILSNALWQELYGGGRRALGRTVRIGGKPYTVVGVMPRGFRFLNSDVRFLTPLAFSLEDRNRYHQNNYYSVGRLKPGATIAQVQAQVNALNAANLERFPHFKEALVNAGFYTKVERLQDVMVKDVKSVLYLLWGGALFVLFIGALNLANVVLARATVRRKAIATRLALGASRAHLLRQFITEHVLVALAGGIAGIVLGDALLRTLTAIGLDHFPRASEVRIDGVVVACALGISAAVGVVLGILPLVHNFKTNIEKVLHEGGRTSTSGMGMRRLRQALVGAEIGFAFVLLMGAGLLLTSFRNLAACRSGLHKQTCSHGWHERSVVKIFG